MYWGLGFFVDMGLILQEICPPVKPGRFTTPDWLPIDNLDGRAWLRLPPRTGRRAWAEDGGLLQVHDGATWIETTPEMPSYLALPGGPPRADTGSR